MKRMLSALLLAGLFLWGASQALAFKPAVLFDMGGKFDKSFNEGIWNGLEKFRKKLVSSTVNLKLHRKPSVSSCFASLPVEALIL